MDFYSITHSFEIAFSNLFILQFIIIGIFILLVLFFYSIICYKIVSNKSINLFIYVSGASLFTAYFFEIFYEKRDSFFESVSSGIVYQNLNFPIVRRLFVLITISYIIFMVIGLFGKEIFRFIIKKRYWLSLLILFLSVTFEISGSSIGLWNDLLGNVEKDSGVLFGIPRHIRSDEWVVTTPLMFSQQYNHHEQFPYFSDTIRGMKTDTGIIGGLPSWNLMTIFRPFQWGFLFLGNAKGYSFFWISRILALLLVSFEFALLFTKKNNLLSVLFSIMITFSPIIQWWYSTSGLEMLVFGLLALLVINRYFREKSLFKKILALLVLIICVGGYVVVLYPAWQIPLMYVFLALFFWLVKSNYKEWTFRLKIDLPLLFSAIAGIAVIFVFIYLQSEETIKIVMNTAYPGKQITLGGGEGLQLFRYLSNFLLPFTTRNLPRNQCEISSFFTFFPFSILLSLYLIFFTKGRKDFFLISILCVELFLIYYITIPLPEKIAKISFLSNSTANRAIFAAGFADALLFIRSLAIFNEKKNEIQSLKNKQLSFIFSLILSLVLSLIVFLLCKAGTGNYLEGIIGIALFPFLFIGFFLCTRIREKRGIQMLTVFFCLLLISSGIVVNPINQGTDAIYKNPLTIQIKQIADQSDGKWIAANESSSLFGNLLIMVGAPTINSTNVYPSLERWRLLDPDHQYEDVYNRYAHIIVELTNKKTEFILLQADQFKLLLNFDDLKKLDVRYLFTNTSYKEKISGITFKEMYRDSKFYIYELTYDE